HEIYIISCPTTIPCTRACTHTDNKPNANRRVAPTGPAPALPLNCPSPGPALPWPCPGPAPELPGSAPDLPRPCPGPAPELPRPCPGPAPELPRPCPGPPPKLPWPYPGPAPASPLVRVPRCQACLAELQPAASLLLLLSWL
ncbi:unnamed protein product, partial [Closterium sp. NIES-54]